MLVQSLPELNSPDNWYGMVHVCRMRNYMLPFESFDHEAFSDANLFK
jgi:hypothetical protein